MSTKKRRAKSSSKTPKKRKNKPLRARLALLKNWVRGKVLKLKKTSLRASGFVSKAFTKSGLWTRRLLVLLGLLTIVYTCSLLGAYQIDQAAVHNAKDSVVMLTPTNLTNRGGTGFLLNTPVGPRTITNAHVCAISKDGTLLAHVDQKPRQILRILKIDNKVDLCVLEPVYGVPALTMGATDVSDYSTVFTWGHPGLRPLTLETGKAMPAQLIELFMGFPVDGLCKAGYKVEVFSPFFGDVEICLISQMGRSSTVRTFGGQSGSPVLNSQGHVIGVIFAGDTATNNGFWVEFGELQAFLSALK